jgi:hypothetical protein
MPIRLLNTTPETVRLPAGKIIGLASSITDNEVITTDHFQGPTLRRIDTGRPAPPIPDHLQQLWEAAQPTCQGEDHQNQLRHLLVRYQHVFSKTDTDVGCTSEVMHSIPTIPGAQPIKQRARRLGPEKEKEVDRQVQELAEAGFIEPGSGAWSSPVVLVRKKDQSWRFCIDYRKLK